VIGTSKVGNPKDGPQFMDCVVPLPRSWDARVTAVLYRRH
jgi:hypothetical protein